MSMTLRAARINRGLSQEKAAVLLSINENTLSNYERGKTYPDVPIIKRIEEVYGVEYKDIDFRLKNML